MFNLTDFMRNSLEDYLVLLRNQLTDPAGRSTNHTQAVGGLSDESEINFDHSVVHNVCYVEEEFEVWHGLIIL